jgi:hypothetical protein
MKTNRRGESMSMQVSRPQRRRTAHVETLHGELCIYEWTTNTVHALNPAAARVWEMCDGVTTIEEMAAAIRRDLNAPGATAIVEHALAQFDRAGLLEPGTFAGVGAVVSRRALLRRIGAAAAIPVVTSIVAPTPLAAQSGNRAQFDWTGGPQTFQIPSGVTSLQVDVVGASGAGFFPTQPPGARGRVQATIPVITGEILTIVVGGIGGLSAGVGGFNGGGGAGLSNGAGGNGGGLVGASGTGTCGGGGGGGTQSTGGVPGTGASGGANASPGTSGQGGKGGDGAPANGGGGGGGGYFGGGGGGGCGLGGDGGAGGGGSSFTDPSATSVVHTQGFGFGNGAITLTW